MIKSKYSNFIVLDIINLKKSFLSFYKKSSSLFLFELSYFFNYNKKNYLVLYFNEFNYFNIKKKFFCFLKDEDVYFEVLFIKYKENMYSLVFFETIFSNNDIFDDFFFFLHFNIIHKLCILNFISIILVLITNNFLQSFKCLLYIKQHLN